MKYSILLLCILIFSFSVIAQDSTVAKASAPDIKQIDGLQTPKPYVYGPGDQIAGKVMGEPDYNFEADVDENGRLLLAFSGTPIVAQCKTERELHAEITELLKRDLKNPQLTLRTLTRARPHVTVFGEVNTKRTVELTRKATLFEMIGLAGGVNKDAGQVVSVYRRQKVACSDGDDPNNWKAESGDANETPFKVFNLAEMEKGVAVHNPEIIPGDVIFVPQAAPAYVVGEVFSPQSILLKRQGGTTVMDAISMVGGHRPEAKIKDVKIYRKRDGYDERQELSINLEKVRKREQKDIIIEPYDLIVVDRTKKSLALTIAEFAIGAGKQVVQSAANTGGMSLIRY